MKYFPLLAAAFAASAFSGAMAQGYQCSTGELSGGPNGVSCYNDPGNRIIEVERQGNGYVRGPIYTPGASASGGWDYQQGYTSMNTHGGSVPFERRGHVSHNDGAATSYGFEWWASDPYYGRTRAAGTHGYRSPGYQSAPHSAGANYHSGRRAHHGQTYATTRPCTYRPSGPVVTTTYSGCPYTAQTQTTYVAPAPQVYTAPAPVYAEPVYSEPDPVYDYESDYDYAPVVALNSGVCRREITELRNDSRGRPRYEVCYRDLQPLYGERMDVLYSRIERAAERACDVNSVYLRSRSSSACEAQAVDRAVYDTGLDALQSYHIAKTGRGRPRVTVGPLRRY